MWPYLIAGLWGVFGVAMLAAGAHGPMAGGPIVSAGQMLLFHALALIAIPTQPRVSGAWRAATLWLLAVGSGLFAFLIALRLLTGYYGLSMLVPVGGLLTIAGWAVFALGALFPRKE